LKDNPRGWTLPQIQNGKEGLERALNNNNPIRRRPSQEGKRTHPRKEEYSKRYNPYSPPPPPSPPSPALLSVPGFMKMWKRQSTYRLKYMKDMGDRKSFKVNKLGFPGLLPNSNMEE